MYDESHTRSHGVKLGRGLRRLDLHLGHFKLSALKPLAQSERKRSGSRVLETLVVHPVLNGLQTQLETRGQMLSTERAFIIQQGDFESKNA